ncbi:MlaA family lipoprotein [Novosphingobium sp.]|jgi:phospholipid-binding lipoprotein MlaA|uniref:MlaA family lipoprotein n=1 Tax=Novosphingobium sp. TaxID=1874826 RepID=UPI002FDFAEE2
MSLPAAAVVILMTGQPVPDAPAYMPAPMALQDAAGTAADAPLAATGEMAGAPESQNSPAPLPGEPAPAPEAPATAPGDPAASPETGPESVIVVTRPEPAPPGDPLQHLNVESFKAVQAVDKAVLEPVAKAYNKGLPRPVRKGLRNFFSNLGEPVVFAAYLLQFKPGKAAETAGRFVINTTLGVAGFVDVAKKKPFNLPYRPNGLANVLGYYGVGPGPYFYLPIVGPTTLRDIVGDTVDKLLLPAAVGKPFTKPAVVLPMTIMNQLGERAAFDEQINKIRKEDRPYAAYRDLYLKQREAEIEALHGRTVPDVVPVYGPGLKTPGKTDGTLSPQGTEPAPVAPTDAAPTGAEPNGVEPVSAAPVPTEAPAATTP